MVGASLAWRTARSFWSSTSWRQPSEPDRPNAARHRPPGRNHVRSVALWTRLVSAGDRLLLVLFLLPPKSDSLMQAWRKVHMVAVYGLDMVRVSWKQENNMGSYSLFVDCAGKNTAACVDVGSCGVEENSLCCCSRVPYLEVFSSMVGGNSQRY
jgi:hypothetical protein